MTSEYEFLRFHQKNAPSWLSSCEDTEMNNSQIFGFAIAHQLKNTNIYVDSTDPITFCSHKKNAKIFATVFDVCNYLCSHFNSDGKSIKRLPNEFKVTPFLSEFEYQEWLEYDQSNWIN